MIGNAESPSCSLDEEECFELLNALFPEGPAGEDVAHQRRVNIGIRTGRLARRLHDSDLSFGTRTSAPWRLTMTRELSGTWYNQHGSELVLEIGEDGKLAGSFRSGTGLAVGAGACPVVGFAAQDLVTFSANFGEYGSLTAWTGHLVTEGEPSLHTMWHMTVLMPSRHPEQDLWKGVWTGSDVFRRTPQERTVGRVPSHPLPDWP